MPQYYIKKSFSLDSVSWTPIVSPLDCNNVGLRNPNAVDVKIRTTSGDPTTEDVIPTTGQEIVVGNNIKGWHPWRFANGVTVVYAQMSSGTGSLVATFIQ